MKTTEQDAAQNLADFRASARADFRPWAGEFFSDKLASSFPTCAPLLGAFTVDAETGEDQYLFATEFGPIIVSYFRNDGETVTGWADEDDLDNFFADERRADAR